MTSLPQSARPSPQPAQPAQPAVTPIKNWFWDAKSRILLGYALLLLGLVGGALPLMRYRLFAQVDARVREDLEEEVEAFDAFQLGEFSPTDLANFQQMERSDPATVLTAQPTTTAEFEAFIALFLKSRVPEDDTFLIALTQDQLYRSSPAACRKTCALASPC